MVHIWLLLLREIQKKWIPTWQGLDSFQNFIFFFSDEALGWLTQHLLSEKHQYINFWRSVFDHMQVSTFPTEQELDKRTMAAEWKTSVHQFLEKCIWPHAGINLSYWARIGQTDHGWVKNISTSISGEVYLTTCRYQPFLLRKNWTKGPWLSEKHQYIYFWGSVFDHR